MACGWSRSGLAQRSIINDTLFMCSFQLAKYSSDGTFLEIQPHNTCPLVPALASRGECIGVILDDLGTLALLIQYARLALHIVQGTVSYLHTIFTHCTLACGVRSGSFKLFSVVLTRVPICIDAQPLVDLCLRAVLIRGDYVA